MTKLNEHARLYGKYVIAKADCTEIDPNAKYFVLRYDASAKYGRVSRAVLSFYCFLMRGLKSQSLRELVSDLNVEAGKDTTPCSWYSSRSAEGVLKMYPINELDSQITVKDITRGHAIGRVRLALLILTKPVWFPFVSKVLADLYNYRVIDSSRLHIASDLINPVNRK